MRCPSGLATKRVIVDASAPSTVYSRAISGACIATAASDTTANIAMTVSLDRRVYLSDRTITRREVSTSVPARNGQYPGCDSPRRHQSAAATDREAMRRAFGDRAPADPGI